MPDVHSKYSPSAASRWLACPGSLLIPAEPESSSQYAAEGTAAHDLGHKCLLLDCDPAIYLGKVVEVDGYTIEVDQEMVDGVRVYIEYIRSSYGANDVYGYEHRLEHSEIEGLGGTVDCLAKLHIFEVTDFKYGAGYAVEAYQNEQLGCYALLCADAFNGGVIDDTRLTIIQPRAHHDEGAIRTWIAPAEWLQDLKDRILEVQSGERHGIHAGEHCRWCPHKAQCPELHELTLLTAKQEFSEPEMTPEKAAAVLKQRKAIETFLDAVDQWVHGQLEKGVEIPGYKLVDTFANRQWNVEESEIVRRCRNRKFGKKHIYKTELLSPAQLEKVVGKDLVASMVERPHKGTTVVPVTDKRPEVKRLTAADEFANVKLNDLETENVAN